MKGCAVYMILNAKWLRAPVDLGEVSPCFVHGLMVEKPVRRATLQASAFGLYAFFVNGKRVPGEVLAPGWTSYNARIQYQTYDVTEMLQAGENELAMMLGKGWALGTIGFDSASQRYGSDTAAAIACLDVVYEDGDTITLLTDESWKVYDSPVLYSDIYHGETADYTIQPKFLGHAVEHVDVKGQLIPQQGERIVECERIAPREIIITPKGERVIDFGQNMTGYVEITLDAKPGDRVRLSHAEILVHGNFYTANLRTAREENTFVFRGGRQTVKPLFTFQGFRYIRLDEYPGETVDPAAFTAVVVHSEMKRTSWFESGHDKLNQLYRNIIWGQKGNFLDVPTDCPQRDERLGWTGDAQVFSRTACINFDVERFYTKWLADMAIDQREDGAVWGIIPNCMGDRTLISAAWGDASVIVPWNMYLAYGNRAILEKQFDCMKGWIEYMHHAGEEEFLWLGGTHYGDWLAMDANDDVYGEGHSVRADGAIVQGESEHVGTDEMPDAEANYVGATDCHLIGAAYFAYSTALFVKIGRILGINMDKYETLHENVVKAFRERYLHEGIPYCKTQTAHVLALYFHLTDHPDKTAASLAEMIRENGMRLKTGFVGTPYLLHALSENGYADIAWNLLLQERFPSWLFSVNMGATTTWEHWDGIDENGRLWSVGMNSFNHYAYGAVCDWIYGVAAGINPVEDGAGYRKIRIQPVPDARLGHLRAGIDTRAGRVESAWRYKDGMIEYEITVPQGAVAQIILPQGGHYTVEGGNYLFYEKAAAE